MKDTLVNILQQRMNKCTTEIFWAVAVITGFCALIVTQKPSFLKVMPYWIFIVAILIMVLYGIFYIIHRHLTYYLDAQDLVSLIRDIPYCPKRMKREPKPWKLRSFTGTAFYILWIIFAGVFSISSLF